MIETAVASPEHAQALAALFRRGEISCFCRYWHFEGSSNDWLARCALDASENEREMITALEAGSPQMQGIVALAPEERVIGWLGLAPAASLAKLYRQRPYAGLAALAGDRRRIFSVGCLYVDRSARRRGVALALLERGVRAARGWGATHLEAFPRSGEGLHDAELRQGPEGLFRELGFAEVARVGMYPVLRLAL